MPDTRQVKLADVLVNYSLALQSGDKLLMTAHPAAMPLLKEIYRAALQAGAHVTTRVRLAELEEIQLREANDAQLTFVSDMDRQEVEYYQAYLSIWAAENTRNLSRVAPERISRARQAGRALGMQLMERAAAGELRWCATLFPTNAYAQEASMPLDEYEEFVYGAGLLNDPDPAASWRKVHAEQQRIADFLMGHQEIRIVAPDTDIRYNVAGRTWMNASGSRNFPDGEVFTGPVEDSVNGVVRFSYPAIYNCNEVEDVRLTFADGKVVDARAARGQQFLDAMLAMDEGARYLGEVAFGLNYGIQRFTRHMLFDEKLGGTMHMALGASYPDTGGKNISSLHWDMLCDLHQGEVYADGTLCYKDGKFNV